VYGLAGIATASTPQRGSSLLGIHHFNRNQVPLKFRSTMGRVRRGT
jgi:hypothetical protein